MLTEPTSAAKTQKTIATNGKLSLMKILFLHGWHSVVGGVKPTFLKNAGYEVINPALDDEDFDAAVKTAQSEYDQHQPDAIIGSSRGGAVAMNIESGDTPLVLLCPAWKKWGAVKRLKPNAVILHSRADDVIPFEDSEELVFKSGLREKTLIEIGDDHRLADPGSLVMMRKACKRLFTMLDYPVFDMGNVETKFAGSVCSPNELQMWSRPTYYHK